MACNTRAFAEHTIEPQPREEHRGARGKGGEKHESIEGPQEELGDSRRAGARRPSGKGGERDSDRLSPPAGSLDCTLMEVTAQTLWL